MQRHPPGEWESSFLSADRARLPCRCGGGQRDVDARRLDGPLAAMRRTDAAAPARGNARSADERTCYCLGGIASLASRSPPRPPLPHNESKEHNTERRHHQYGRCQRAGHHAARRVRTLGRICIDAVDGTECPEHEDRRHGSHGHVDEEQKEEPPHPRRPRLTDGRHASKVPGCPFVALAGGSRVLTLTHMPRWGCSSAADRGCTGGG